MPVERGRDAFRAIPTGYEERRERENEDEPAQRVRVASVNARHRRSGFQSGRCPQRSFQMRAPERDRNRVAGLGRHAVGNRGGRPVRHKTFAVEPAQTFESIGPTHLEQRDGRRDGQHEESEHADGAAERRQRHPEAEPGQREEQPGRGRDRGERRPQVLPEQRQSGAAQRARQQGFSSPGLAQFVRLFGGFAQISSRAQNLSVPHLNTRLDRSETKQNARLVSRFRSSHTPAVSSDANFGIKGTLASI